MTCTFVDFLFPFCCGLILGGGLGAVIATYLTCKGLS